MSGAWPWIVLVALGMFHGVNPAMGWLFAVGLGLHRGRRAVVLWALVPIALGHALAVGLVVAVIAAIGVAREAALLAADAAVLQAVGGAALVGWGVYHQVYGRRHRARVGMRAGFGGLVLWSFLMANAHGAGLMLVPVLLPLEVAGVHAHGAAGPLGIALLATAVHTGAMLATTGAIAVLVYEWVGVAFLRRGWINLDLVWSLALLAIGAFLLARGVGALLSVGG